MVVRWWPRPEIFAQRTAEPAAVANVVYESMRENNFAAALASCGGGAQYSGIGQDGPQIIGEDIWVRLQYQPESYFGQSVWPEVSNTLTIGTQDYEVPCADIQGNMDSATVAVNVQCDDYHVATDKGFCYPPCPGELFSEESIAAQKGVYIGLGYLAGLISFALLVTLIRNGAFSRNKKNQNVNVVKIQVVGCILCIFYFLVGPWLSSINGRDLKCNGEPTLGNANFLLVDDSFACQVSKCQSYLILAILNLIIFHQIITGHSLRMSKTMRKSSDAKSYFNPQSCCAILLSMEPIILCVIMYALDRPGKTMTLFEIEVSRDSFVCSPRLSVNAEFQSLEFALVHLSLVVSSLVVTVLSFKNMLFVNSMRSGKNGSGTNKASESNTSGASPCVGVKFSSDNLLQSLLKKLAILGLISGLLVVIYIIVILHSLGQINVAAQTRSDLILCQDPEGLLIQHIKPFTVASCDEYWDKHALRFPNGTIDKTSLMSKSIGYIAVRAAMPGTAESCLIWFCQAAFVMLFASFYLIIQ